MISPMMCVYGLCCTLDLILQSSHLVIKEKYKFLFLLLLLPPTAQSALDFKNLKIRPLHFEA